ncbi:Uncharacterised protein [Yersinia enterocolitica]|nr:Uncharacterised protein [Yersinia enterocolitica]CQJ20288.1 Uncharacterised protein [Yersinia enterocolitica]
MAHLLSTDYLFQSQISSSQHISTRQYSRIFHVWIEKFSLDDTLEISESIEV